MYIAVSTADNIYIIRRTCIWLHHYKRASLCDAYNCVQERVSVYFGVCVSVYVHDIVLVCVCVCVCAHKKVWF